jgi:DNA-binding XRE family transcriptional regulator
MTIQRNGKRFALVPIDQYRKLIEDRNLPPLPPADGHGNREALAFARATIARTLVRDRRAAGLSQQQLAKIAGVRQETISRIESGKQTATVRIIDKLDRAIRKTSHQQTSGSSRPRRRSA